MLWHLSYTCMIQSRPLRWIHWYRKPTCFTWFKVDVTEFARPEHKINSCFNNYMEKLEQVELNHLCNNLWPGLHSHLTGTITQRTFAMQNQSYRISCRYYWLCINQFVYWLMGLSRDPCHVPRGMQQRPSSKGWIGSDWTGNCAYIVVGAVPAVLKQSHVGQGTSNDNISPP